MQSDSYARCIAPVRRLGVLITIVLTLLLASPLAAKQLVAATACREQPACGGNACAASPECGCQAAEAASAKAAAAYKPLFYENDFSYLLDPAYGGWLPGESLKQLEPAPWLTLDVGGQYRARYHHEQNMRGLGLTGRDDRFLLHRSRLFANAQLGERFRVYAEYIDAVSNYEDFAPRPIEENRSDVLNGFIDARLLEACDGSLWARAGRQELLYGDQRAISPLDWANTRRTFDGAKVFWRGEQWDADAFWTRPVPPDARNFDNPDLSQEFLGLYTTYKGLERGPLDLYFLRYAEYSGAPDFDFNTFGARRRGELNNWLWDLEGAYQFGNFGAADASSGFFTCGGGRRFEAPWNPTLWLYYDWAEGDETQGAGYHHLFPLGHRYLGFMDLFGRRNIEDFNVLLTAAPREKITLQAWWHVFWLQRGDDIPYNVLMGPSPAIGTPIVPGGSRYLGQELDLLAAWALHPRMELQLGYSYFWSGEWFDTNPTPGLFRGDAHFLYTQYQFNF